jgi:hypothetical protein
MIQEDINAVKNYVEFGVVNPPLRSNLEQLLVYIQYLEFKLEPNQRKDANGQV